MLYCCGLLMHAALHHPLSHAQVALHPPGGTWNGDLHNLKVVHGERSSDVSLSCCAVWLPFYHTFISALVAWNLGT
jgi:hypothetical protein